MSASCHTHQLYYSNGVHIRLCDRHRSIVVPVTEILGHILQATVETVGGWIRFKLIC